MYAKKLTGKLHNLLHKPKQKKMNKTKNEKAISTYNPVKFLQHTANFTNLISCILERALRTKSQPY